jgi:ABC-type spermidine/putrescine transport system permease subunit I
MNTYIILGIIVGLPLLLTLILRVSAVFLFLGVAGGILLSQYIAEDAALVLNLISPHGEFNSYAKLALLLIPVLLTMFFLKKTVQLSKLFLHIIPIAITVLVLGSFIIKVLPGGIQYNIASNPLAKTLDTAQNVLLGSATAITLILAWLTMRHKKGHTSNHK